MTARKIGIGLVLLAFADLTAYALYQHGVAGVVRLEMANSVTVTAFVDLVIGVLASLQAGCTELACHPGEGPPPAAQERP